MNFLPIVDRELRVAARRAGTYWTRLVFAIVGAGIVSLALLYASVAGTGAAGIGGGLFYFLSLLALGFSALAGVFPTADCLSEERREGTLGLLFLTDLKGYDVVFGKLLARSLSACHGLIAIFPVLATTLTMGGVTAGEFWRMALVLLNTIFFSLAAGMFVSSVSQQDHRAMAGAAGLIVLIAGVLPLAEFILNKAGLAVLFTLSLPSPVTAWRLAFDAPFRMWGRSFGYSLLLAQGLSWVLLILAGIQLPRLWRTGDGAASLVGGKAAAARETARLRRATRWRPLLDQNPVYWLATRNSRIHRGSWVIWATLAVGLDFLVSSNPTRGIVAGQQGWPFLLTLLRIFVGVYACRFFVESRRTGTLELLLCTPLTVEEILGGQWMALRRLFLVPTIVLLCAGILPLALTFLTFLTNLPNVPYWLWMGSLYVYAVPKLICDLLAAAWVGMLVGLTAKKPNLAPGLTVLYTVVLPVAAFCIPDVMISLPLSLWARDRLHRELRKLSSPRYAPVAPLYSARNRPAFQTPPVIPG